MDNALLHVLQLTDPTLPIGGYAHSAGLETYVQQGAMHNLLTASAFVMEILTQNLQYNDAAFVSLAYGAALKNNFDKIIQLDAECNAVKLPMEMRQASQKLGIRLNKIFQSVCNDALAISYKNAIDTQQASGHYCIAFGIYAAAPKYPSRVPSQAFIIMLLLAL